MVLYPLFHPSAALRATAVLELLRADFGRLPGLMAERSSRDTADEAGAGDGSGAAKQLGFFG